MVNLHLIVLVFTQVGLCVVQAASVLCPVSTTYIRWGRKVCPSTSRLVYAGFAGKSHHNHGRGVNYQCLPTDPEWPLNAVTGYQTKAFMYGVEYEHIDSPVLPSSIDDQDVPCAVCLVCGRSAQIMIPAKHSCPSNWITEYTGYLVSQHFERMGSTFECLDINFEFDNGGQANLNGGSFYIVEAKCGSLPCPPYEDGKELSCAVCTY